MLLTVKSLKKYFPITRGLLRRKIADVKAVDDISFEINKHETLGLVGESGLILCTEAYVIPEFSMNSMFLLLIALVTVVTVFRFRCQKQIR